MNAAKPTSQATVTEALAFGNEMTSPEIAATVGLGRSTVTKALAALERTGVVRRHPGGHDGRRRLADRWSVAQVDEPSPPADRLRPGELDRLVLDYISSNRSAVGVTAVATALGRSAGAVGNCLTRLAAAGRVRKVSDKPRRYASVTSTPRPGARATRRREERS